MQPHEQFRELMNAGRVAEMNALISDDFFAVFTLGNSGVTTMYDAEEIREGNVQAHEYYAGKNPRWNYTDLSSGMRSETEFIVSSQIEFTLDGEPNMNALVMEVYREEDGQWKLLRQFMEKYRP